MLLASIACTSNDGGTTGSTTAAAVTGAADAHCAGKTVVVDPGICHAAPDAAADGTVDYGPTMFGAEGDDDDCKYHVKWSAASGNGSGPVTFTVTVTNKKDGSPVAGAPVEIEAFLDETHPAPKADPGKETSTPGTYTVPVTFDKSGQWTVRFHIHDDCSDTEESPHGHAAFFVQITQAK